MADKNPTDDKWTSADLVALSSLQALTRGYIPWTAFSMRPAAVASIVNDLEMSQRRVAVEIGAGSSTLFFGHALRETGGRLVTIEHDGRYGAYIQRLINREGLEDTVRLEVVPLVPWTPAEPPAEDDEWSPAERWYDPARVLEVTPEGIDLLVVDGPPAAGALDRLVRAPALEVLEKKLAPDHSIFLDDTDRAAELATLERWSQRLGITLRHEHRIGTGIGRSDGRFIPTL